MSVTSIQHTSRATRSRRTVIAMLVAALAVAAAPAVGGPAGRGAACADGALAGGTWPTLNADLSNTRDQPAERLIGTAEVGDLAVAWSFDSAALGIPGNPRSTPVAAGGCVFVAFGEGYLGARGDVIALDAVSGELVWHTQVKGSVLGLAVDGGLVYATPSEGTRGDAAVQSPVVTDDYVPTGSYAIALDARTGELVWKSERLDDGDAANGTFINASPVVFSPAGQGRTMVFVPLAGGAGDGAMVPMYFLDARTGATVKRALSLTPEEYELGYGGTGIWTTAAYDPATQHLYAGTSDSDGLRYQHPYNNAILRIDANPARPTFGTVVGHYSGTSEHADLDEYIGSQNNPACGLTSDTVGIPTPTFVDTSASPECLELDLDFGASPNLHRGADGQLKVSALQKSGVFHTVDSTTMTADWTFFVGPGGPAMHSSTAAVADGRLLVGASPNLFFGLDRQDGSVDWAATHAADVFSYQPVSHANGVLYTITDAGTLLALDAATGLPLTEKLLTLDGGFPQCLGVGAGVAIAYGTVLATCDAAGPDDLAGLPATPGGVVAYRLPR